VIYNATAAKSSMSRGMTRVWWVCCSSCRPRPATPSVHRTDR